MTAGATQLTSTPVRATSFAIDFVERDHRSLRRRVGGRHRVALLAGDRRDVDDPAVAALDHAGEHGAVAEEDAVGVDREDALPLGVVDVDRPQRAAGDPRAADEDVDRPELDLHLCDRGLHLAGVGDVAASASTPSGPPAWRSNVATWAPSRSSRSAVARPIPLDPPVTSATSPGKSMIVCHGVSLNPKVSAAWSSTRTATIRSGLRRPELVTTPAGTPLAEVTLDAARAGGSSAPRSGRPRTTLRRQADVARAAGASQLAENLERAAELAAVPDDELLEIYTALRPRRSTAPELESWAAAARRAGARRARLPSSARRRRSTRRGELLAV